MTTVLGTLESAVNLSIGKLAGYNIHHDYWAAILVAHSNFQQRVDIIGALCEQLVPEYPELRGYKSVVKKIEAAPKGRNKFAHNGLTLNEETGAVQVSYLSARGALKTKVEVVRVNDIKEVSAKIHEAMCALLSLISGYELLQIGRAHV